MTKPFTTQELQLLLAPHPAPCISIFLPTHRRPPGAQQDPVRFKNLLDTAEGLLREQYAPEDVRMFLDPLQVLSNNGLWPGQLEGLAVFRSPDFTAYYRIPMPLPELAVVADTFHVKPLLGFLQSNRHFFVLALSRNSAAFYAGTPYALGRVNVPRLPASLSEVLGSDRKESFRNSHAAAASGATAIFHGHGGPEENQKADLERFLRAIDNVLWERLRDERAPLVLVGVGYSHAIYRAISRYRHLAQQSIEGNFEHATPTEIHTKVWPIVSELFRAREDAVLDQYERCAGGSLVTDDLHVIARATVHGRVRHLLVAEDRHFWGMLDRATGTVMQHPSQQDSRDDDILDDLAECVLARGGEVLLVPAERMPSSSPVAAILRW